MVMHVEVQNESSFFSVDDSINVVLIEESEHSDNSMSVIGLDRSSLNQSSSSIPRSLHAHTHTPSTRSGSSSSSNNNKNNANSSTNSWRLHRSLNTQTSILDLSREDDEEEEDGDHGDDDDDDDSVLFHDLHEANPLRLQADMDSQQHNENDNEVAITPVTAPSSRRNILGRFSPDHFFDSICSTSPSDAEGITQRTFTDENSNPNTGKDSIPLSSTRSRSRSRTCPKRWSPNCINAEGVGGVVPCGPCVPSPTEDEDELIVTHPTTSIVQPSTPSTERLQVEMDIWALLGCNSPMNVLELQYIWGLTTTIPTFTTPDQPQTASPPPQWRASRACLKERMNRIHRLRHKDYHHHHHRHLQSPSTTTTTTKEFTRTVTAATRHGITLSQHGTYSPSPITSLKSVSMDAMLDSKDYSTWNDSNRNAMDISFASVMGFSKETSSSSSPSSPSSSMRGSRVRLSSNGQPFESSTLTGGGGGGFVDRNLPILELDGYDSDPELSCVHPDRTHSSVHNNDCDANANTNAIDSGKNGIDMNKDKSHFSQDAEDVFGFDNVIQEGSEFDLCKRLNMRHPEEAAADDDEDRDFLIYQTVQQTLNSTWTLKWHPNVKNCKDFHVLSDRSIMINIWMERGTVISHTGVVVEPMFMWRDAYQSHDLLHQRKRLNSTCQKPWSMRLLNTCRVAPCRQNLDKSKYPLARAAHCFAIKTCEDQEFILEANSEEEMDRICEYWKLTVARFASLAVTEDIDAISQEFFHPTLSSQTLTVQGAKDVSHDNSLPFDEQEEYGFETSNSFSSTSSEGTPLVSSPTESFSPAKSSCSSSTTPTATDSRARRYVDI